MGSRRTTAIPLSLVRMMKDPQRISKARASDRGRQTTPLATFIAFIFLWLRQLSLHRRLVLERQMVACWRLLRCRYVPFHVRTVVSRIQTGYGPGPDGPIRFDDPLLPKEVGSRRIQPRPSRSITYRSKSYTCGSWSL